MNRLNQTIDLVATASGVFGALMCLLAVIVRLVAGPGNPKEVFVVAPRSMLLGAIALMVFACFLKLTIRRSE